MKQAGIGRYRSARLFAGHRMAAQELAAAKSPPRQVDDIALGAARVGDQRIGPHQRIQMTQGIEDPADGRG